MLNEEKKKCYRLITGAVMYFGLGSLYDILFAVNQLARALSKASKARTTTAEHILPYLTGSVISIFHKRRGFKLATYSNDNWGNNSDNGRSTSLYIGMFANGLTSFKVGLQSVTAQPTTEAVLVAVAITWRRKCSAPT